MAALSVRITVLPSFGSSLLKRGGVAAQMRKMKGEKKLLLLVPLIAAGFQGVSSESKFSLGGYWSMLVVSHQKSTGQIREKLLIKK